jgi:hypothetical protein
MVLLLPFNTTNTNEELSKFAKIFFPVFFCVFCGLHFLKLILIEIWVKMIHNNISGKEKENEKRKTCGTAKRKEKT